MSGHRIGFCLLVASLIMSHGVVLAEEWIALEARYQFHSLQTTYVDFNTIRREGNLVVLSALIDWKAMQGGRAPTRFYSSKVTKQFYCAEGKVRTLAGTDYDHHMGMGEIIGGGVPASEKHWVDVELGTINQGLWEVACNIR